MAGKQADLVLEGGGVKGIGLAGAYSVLQENGYTINRVAGTSAGAIVGALIAADIPADQLQKLMREIDYREFEDKGFLDLFGLPGKTLSILREKGIYEGKFLRNWLHEILEGLGAQTFGDLRVDDPGSSLPKDKAYKLVVMASDVTRGQLVRLPWDYHEYGKEPDGIAVADAVRASMSIPFFFEPVKQECEDKATGKKTECLLVDGGMLSNFPIEVFDRTDGKPPRWPTFGIKLSARPDAARIQKFDTGNTLDYIKAMVGTMTSFHDQMHIEDPTVLARTIFVDTMKVKATDFDIDEKTQEQLYQNGRTAAEEFLAEWSFEKYVEACRSGKPGGRG